MKQTAAIQALAASITAPTDSVTTACAVSSVVASLATPSATSTVSTAARTMQMRHAAAHLSSSHASDPFGPEAAVSTLPQRTLQASPAKRKYATVSAETVAINPFQTKFRSHFDAPNKRLWRESEGSTADPPAEVHVQDELPAQSVTAAAAAAVDAFTSPVAAANEALPALQPVYACVPPVASAGTLPAHVATASIASCRDEHPIPIMPHMLAAAVPLISSTVPTRHTSAARLTSAPLSQSPVISVNRNAHSRPTLTTSTDERIRAANRNHALFMARLDCLAGSNDSAPAHHHNPRGVALPQGLSYHHGVTGCLKCL